MSANKRKNNFSNESSGKKKSKYLSFTRGDIIGFEKKFPAPFYLAFVDEDMFDDVWTKLTNCFMCDQLVGICELKSANNAVGGKKSILFLTEPTQLFKADDTGIDMNEPFYRFIGLNLACIVENLNCKCNAGSKKVHFRFKGKTLISF